jgi:FMN reductase
MPDVVVVSGDPQARSATLSLARAVGERIAHRHGTAAPVTVDVAELGPGLVDASDGPTGAALLEVQDATLLVVATPARLGSYSGVLKVLLDHLPPNALAGVVAVPVVTADRPAHAETAEAFLARLLRELGADVVDFGLTATGSELTDPDDLADQYATALIA